MINRDCTHTISSARAFPCKLSDERPASMTGWLKTFSAFLSRTFAEWRTRSAHRRHLSEMSDYQLSDIGITRDQADREASRPFWVGSVRVDDWSRRSRKY